MKTHKRTKNITNLHNAIVDYISNNSTFESNEAIDDVIKKIERSKSFEEIFRIPIENRLFNFVNALQWLYFICFLINTMKEECISVPSIFNINFSTDSAIIYISNKYNAANKTFKQDYFNDSDSSESDE